MNNSIVLVTKDAMCKAYLPCYGNQYWKGKTPNLDELASKGIVYNRFYTAAPSSAMSYLCMFTGKYPYQQEIGTFKPIDTYGGTTLFDKANQMGFKTHVIWDEGWMDGAYKYSSCYGKETKIHPIKDLSQRVGAQFVHEGFLVPDDSKAENSVKLVDEEIKKIMDSDEKVFLWIHLPHVINGRVCYGEDIDLFDKIVGVIRQYFSDDNIFISSDHGNMNGQRGKLAYGFDVYDRATQIPLITPVCDNSVGKDALMCNIDFYSILFGAEIPKREYIFLDSAYYAQENRSLGIVSGKYKYIYHKKERYEELFDLEYDKNEEFNLIDDKIFDVDRKVWVPSREEYFYPYWNDMDEIRTKFRGLKDSIWREASAKQKSANKAKDLIRPFYIRLRKIVKR